MKKILLSIFAVMLAVFSVQAEEVSGKIIFKTAGSDASNAATTANFVSGQVTDNGGFTLSCTATNNCYTGKSGLKMSSGSKNGSFTLNLGGTYNVKTITVSAAKYGSDAGKVAVNGATAQSLSSSNATDYTFAVNSEINQIKVDMTKRGYIASITIVYEVAGEGGGTVETEPEPEPETPENIEGGTVSFTASENGYTNGLAIATVEMNSYIVATFNKGTNSNPPKYYTSGTSIRCYGGNTFTIASTAGNITEIVLTFGEDDGSNAITANVGSCNSGTWTGAAQSVTFTVGGSSGNRRIAGIKVTYAGKSAGEPEIINVEQPVISSDKAEYAVGEEAVVTITTATEGATIYYSLDGSEPTTVYTEPIVLDETTTVKAVAKMKGANDSPLAEKIIEFKKVVTLVNATVAEVIAAYNSGDVISDDATVVGYIVGAVDGSINNSDNFASETTINTNIILADDANETNVENCIIVELPKGSVRDALNLADNSKNYKKKVVLTGDVMAYFKVAGLKNTSAYEFIPEYTLSVTAAGYATLFLDFNAAIPTNVEAYTVTEVNNGYVTLTQVEGVLPANTGVIIKAGEGNYTFAYSKETPATVEGNLLQGTTKDIVIESAAYVLGIYNGVVGLYTAKTEGQAEGTFINYANKAYLPKTAGMNAASYSFRFGEGTTAIENVEVENEVKAIYDLTGRRVEALTAPGIYIVGGKKVLVK